MKELYSLPFGPDEIRSSIQTASSGCLHQPRVPHRSHQDITIPDKTEMSRQPSKYIALSAIVPNLHKIYLEAAISNQITCAPRFPCQPRPSTTLPQTHPIQKTRFLINSHLCFIAESRVSNKTQWKSLNQSICRLCGS